jgi:hypothetical protein
VRADQLVDLLGAFEDVEDLAGTGEGRTATTADLPSDAVLLSSALATNHRLPTSHGAVTEQNDLA